MATGIAIGTTVTAAVYSSQSCTTTTVLHSGVTYYRCGSNWYTRAYQGGTVSYVVVSAPPGY
jgi:hypothetical protein